MNIKNPLRIHWQDAALALLCLGTIAALDVKLPWEAPDKPDTRHADAAPLTPRAPRPAP